MVRIDFKKPDGFSQIIGLKSLLKNPNPSKEEIALAMLLTLRIFYEHRLDRLYEKTKLHTEGLGCNNPMSYKDRKVLMGITRFELSIEYKDEFYLELSHEYTQNGFFKGVFSRKELEWVVTADIFHDATESQLIPKSVLISGSNQGILMEELRLLIEVPLSVLNTKILKSVE